MKGLLGLGLAVFTFLSSAHGEVAVYKQHLVVSQTGSRSRTVQTGWALIDLTTHEIATVSLNKKTRRFSIEFLRSSNVTEQHKTRSTSTTTVEEGSLRGLKAKGNNKTYNFHPGASMVAPNVLRVTGSNGSARFHGNLVFDKRSTFNAYGQSPSTGLQYIIDHLEDKGYSEQ